MIRLASVVRAILSVFLPHSTGPGSCKIDLIHFLSWWHKMRCEPGFSFAYVNQSISTYLVPRLHKSRPTRHYKWHHSTHIVKTAAVIKAHIKKMSLEFPFESSSAMSVVFTLLFMFLCCHLLVVVFIL